MKSLLNNAPSPIVLKKGHELYPKRLECILGSKAPKCLHTIGNLNLLKLLNGLGFCGSRDVSEIGLEIAHDCARQAVEQTKIIISGNARGVDRMVHKTALEHGGCTIFVLPEGINNFRIHNDLKEVWDWKRVLVISEFPPDTGWKTWNAMKRNKTILGLVSTMIVIEAGAKGGTIAAGREALKFRIPLFVVNRHDFDGTEGSKHLIEMGGFKLNKSETRGIANMKPIFKTMTDYANKIANKEVQCNLI